jgi:hypothetical protein
MGVPLLVPRTAGAAREVQLGPREPDDHEEHPVHDPFEVARQSRPGMRFRRATKGRVVVPVAAAADRPRHQEAEKGDPGKKRIDLELDADQRVGLGSALPTEA